VLLEAAACRRIDGEVALRSGHAVLVEGDLDAGVERDVARPTVRQRIDDPERLAGLERPGVDDGVAVAVEREAVDHTGLKRRVGHEPRRAVTRLRPSLHPKRRFDRDSTGQHGGRLAGHAGQPELRIECEHAAGLVRRGQLGDRRRREARDRREIDRSRRERGRGLGGANTRLCGGVRRDCGAIASRRPAPGEEPPDKGDGQRGDDPDADADARSPPGLARRGIRPMRSPAVGVRDLGGSGSCSCAGRIEAGWSVGRPDDGSAFRAIGEVGLQPVDVPGGEPVRRHRRELAGSFVVEHRIDSPSGIDQAGCGTLGRVAGDDLLAPRDARSFRL
jgi:hypothetical protein